MDNKQSDNQGSFVGINNIRESEGSELSDSLSKTYSQNLGKTNNMSEQDNSAKFSNTPQE